MFAKDNTQIEPMKWKDELPWVRIHIDYKIICCNKMQQVA